MPGCVSDGDRRALREPEYRRALDTSGVEDDAEIREEVLHPETGRIPVGESVAACVITDQAVAAAECRQPVSPDGARVIELEMTEPVRDLDEGRTLAKPRMGEACPVGSAGLAPSQFRHPPRR